MQDASMTRQILQKRFKFACAKDFAKRHSMLVGTADYPGPLVSPLTIVAKFPPVSIVKGRVSGDLLPLFYYHDSNPSGLLIHKLFGVFHTTEILKNWNIILAKFTVTENENILACLSGGQPGQDGPIP